MVEQFCIRHDQSTFMALHMRSIIYKIKRLTQNGLCDQAQVELSKNSEHSNLTEIEVLIQRQTYDARSSKCRVSVR